MTASNLGSEIEALFRQVGSSSAQLTSQQGAITVLQVWQAALGAEGSDDVVFYRLLSIVSYKLNRLSTQIKQSEELSAGSQSIAIGIINGLKRWLQPASFNMRAVELQETVQNQALDMLSVFSLQIRREFPEPTLSQDDADIIATELDEIGMFTKNAEISAELKELILTHLAFMTWAIRNVRIVGLEGILNAFGSGVLAARQVYISQFEFKSGLPGKVSKTIYERICDNTKKVLRLLRLTHSGLQDISDLRDDIQGLLP